MSGDHLEGASGESAIMKRYAAISVVAVMLLAAASSALPLTGSTGGGQPHENRQPSLGVNYIIAMQGVFPSRSSGTPPVEPTSSEPLLGEIRLFAGNFAPRGWVFPDGQVLPIAQNTALYSILGTAYGGDGRTSFALPDLRGRTAIHAGNGPGLTNRPLGQKTGVDSVTLTQAQMPAHSHTLPWLDDRTLQTGGGQPYTNMQPSLALNYLVALQGIYPSRSPGTPPGEITGLEPLLGEVTLFAGNFAPRGWARTDGQLLAIPQNDALFSLLGTIYGGDGRTTFGLPDLRGRAAMHAGSGPGLTPRPLGQKTGVENITLTLAQMPAHDHTLPPTTLRTGDTGGGQSHKNMQPSQVLHYIIALQGTYPSRSPGLEDDPPIVPPGSEPFLGEISLFAGTFAPRGWAFCDGQVLAISQNDALFSLLGTTYGGDGRTTFALPDLRGRVPVHPGTGPGLATWRLGQKGGLESVTLTVDELPSHNHVVPEPATGALCLLVLAGLVARRRRRPV
jgi:microcystin-dependent protein